MEITFAKRMDSFQEGIFTVLNKKKNELLAQGRTIYNLSVGTPDFKPAPHVMQALTESASKPENYKYSLVERPALLEAMQNFYNRRFGVRLDTKQIMAVNGSQEAMTHICWALCDPGDVVLVPNPGYPIFEVGRSCAVPRLSNIRCMRKMVFCRSFPISRRRQRGKQR